MNIKNEKGVALAITLLVTFMLVSFGAIFILRTVNEKNLVEQEQERAKAFYIAEGGINAAVDQLDTLINTYMLNTVNATSPQAILNSAQSSVASGEGVDFLIATVLNSGNPELTKVGSQAEYYGSQTNLGTGNYEFDIFVTEKTNPYVSGPDEWAFEFYYQVDANGAASGVSQNVILSGDFTVTVQRDNFAKYALFTNAQTLPNGTNVWFTDKTNFAGPIHTNGRYNIALNPSGTFEGLVEQVEETARFYNGGYPILLNAESNPGYDVPTFNAGFNRDRAAISLSSSVQKQDMIDQARAGDTTPGNGIFIANNGTNLTGGVYVNGDSTVALSVDGSDNAVYTITQGSTTKTITVDRSNDQTSIDNGSTTAVYNGIPDGVDNVGTLIFVDGNISSFSGTVQKDTEVTVSSEGDVVISNHVHYADHVAAVGTPGQPGYVPPSASGTKNLLGVVTWNGDVRIGTGAPNDIDVHGTLLAQNGIYQVDNYNDTGVGGRGTATLLGGVITDFYGAFGLFNGSTGQQVAGFGRNFVYDTRMQVGNAPPYFPSLDTFIAFTNDITDKIVWKQDGV